MNAVTKSVPAKKNLATDQEYLTKLRDFIHAQGAELGEGWQAHGKARQHGQRPFATYISPGGSVFRSKVEVARSLNIRITGAKPKKLVVPGQHVHNSKSTGAALPAPVSPAPLPSSNKSGTVTVAAVKPAGAAAAVKTEKAMPSSIQKSSRGRLRLPPQEFWRNQLPTYDKDYSLIVSPALKLEPQDDALQGQVRPPAKTAAEESAAAECPAPKAAAVAAQKPAETPKAAAQPRKAKLSMDGVPKSQSEAVPTMVLKSTASPSAAVKARRRWVSLQDTPSAELVTIGTDTKSPANAAPPHEGRVLESEMLTADPATAAAHSSPPIAAAGAHTMQQTPSQQLKQKQKQQVLTDTCAPSAKGPQSKGSTAVDRKRKQLDSVPRVRRSSKKRAAAKDLTSDDQQRTPGQGQSIGAAKHPVAAKPVATKSCPQEYVSQASCPGLDHLVAAALQQAAKEEAERSQANHDAADRKDLVDAVQPAATPQHTHSGRAQVRASSLQGAAAASPTTHVDANRVHLVTSHQYALDGSSQYSQPVVGKNEQIAVAGGPAAARLHRAATNDDEFCVPKRLCLQAPLPPKPRSLHQRAAKQKALAGLSALVASERAGDTSPIRQTASLGSPGQGPSGAPALPSMVTANNHMPAATSLSNPSAHAARAFGNELLSLPPSACVVSATDRQLFSQVPPAAAAAQMMLNTVTTPKLKIKLKQRLQSGNPGVGAAARCGAIAPTLVCNRSERQGGGVELEAGSTVLPLVAVGRRLRKLPAPEHGAAAVSLAHGHQQDGLQDLPGAACAAAGAAVGPSCSGRDSDGWTQAEIAKLHEWHWKLNPAIKNFWQELANIVGKSPDECCAKMYAALDEQPTGAAKAATRPTRYLAAVDAQAPVPQLGSKGVGPAAVRRVARTAWWTQRAEQRGINTEGVSAEERQQFLAEMAEQERTDRYIDAVRKHSRLLQQGQLKALRPVAQGAFRPRHDAPLIIDQMMARAARGLHGCPSDEEDEYAHLYDEDDGEEEDEDGEN